VHVLQLYAEKMQTPWRMRGVSTMSTQDVQCGDPARYILVMGTRPHLLDLLSYRQCKPWHRDQHRATMELCLNSHVCHNKTSGELAFLEMTCLQMIQRMWSKCLEDDVVSFQ
jgi:glutamate/tyrosine decarboxylase-like PLP-dependent enzyme